MITNLMEGTRSKCTQYWPDYGSTEYGPFRVALTDEVVYADYTIRTFLVSVSAHSTINMYYVACNLLTVHCYTI